MTTSISCRSDSKLDHNKGGLNIKSDAVSTKSSGSSSDVTHTSLVGGPVLSLINKRLRSHSKKLNRILRMQEFLAQGKPLNKEQSQLLESKSAISALIDELEKLKKLLASAVSEEISRASQCHAISAQNATCQNEDQEKASEDREFKAHKELPIYSRSDHNKGRTKIKSDVLVGIDSGGFTSDVTDTTLVGGPVLSLINKRLRNHSKKLNRVLRMEEFLTQGKPLNKEQADLLQSKSAISALIDELEKLKKPLASAVSEEIFLASQCHAISAENAACQDDDQEKACEHKDFKAHRELPIYSRSDHNEGSTKIKSDVLVGIECGRFSSDVTDTTLVGGPVLSLINKRLRNHSKKLNRILRMEEFLTQGKPLNKEQADLLQSKSAVSARIDELEKLKKPLTSAVSEEIFLASQCHAISAENAACQDDDQEKACEDKEFKAHKELPINPKSDHDGSTKDVMSTEHGRPSQGNQQNEGIALPLRTDLKQMELKWKIRCKKYLEENWRLLLQKDVLEHEFERLNLSSFLLGIRRSLLSRWPTTFNSNADQQNDEDQEEENSLIDQQNEEFSLSPWDAEVLGISDKDKIEGVDWEKCCRELRAANMWVKEQLREYKDGLDVLKELAVEFPELTGGKPAVRYK